MRSNGRVPLTLFIAEDNRSALESLVELLSARAGVEVVGTASSELEATNWLASHPGPWDVLVTDLLLLPGGSGFGLVRHARSLGAFRHVVVFSEFLTAAVGERCVKLGADAVFLKSELEGLFEYLRQLGAGS